MASAKKKAGIGGNPFQVVEPLRGCRWPVGDPRDAGFHHCGERQEIGRPYCAAHVAIAYDKPPKKEKPSDDPFEKARPSKQTRRKPMGRLEAALNG